MNTVLQNMWVGMWQGIGMGILTFIFLVTWSFLYHRLAHKVDRDHFLHRIHEYLTK